MFTNPYMQGPDIGQGMNTLFPRIMQMMMMNRMFPGQGQPPQAPMGQPAMQPGGGAGLPGVQGGTAMPPQDMMPQQGMMGQTGLPPQHMFGGGMPSSQWAGAAPQQMQQPAFMQGLPQQRQMPLGFDQMGQMQQPAFMEGLPQQRQLPPQFFGQMMGMNPFQQWR